MNIIFALPIAEKLSITNVYIEGTTIIPHDVIDNTLISNIQKSSNHLYESVNALQSAIKILFPKKDQHERNFTIDRQSLLIGCIINRGEVSEEPRRACKGLHEKKDKNIYYEFEDKSLEDIDHLPIHVEHINVARVKNDKEKSNNDTIEEIQKLIAIENRLINNETDRERMNFDSISDSPSSQNLINQSTPLDVSLNTIDVNRSKNGNNGGMFQWLSSTDTNDKTIDILSNLKTVKQVPQNKSIYSINEQKDDNGDGENFKTDEIFSKLDNKSTCIPILLE
jgi:hypothetical protein